MQKIHARFSFNSYAVQTMHVFDEETKQHIPAKALVIQCTASKSDMFSRSTPVANLSMTITNKTAAQSFKRLFDTSEKTPVEIDCYFDVPEVPEDAKELFS